MSTTHGVISYNNNTSKDHKHKSFTLSSPSICHTNKRLQAINFHISFHEFPLKGLFQLPTSNCSNYIGVFPFLNIYTSRGRDMKSIIKTVNSMSNLDTAINFIMRRINNFSNLNASISCIMRIVNKLRSLNALSLFLQ
jgi:hypothetical protein